jgi:hypothetical protein
MGKAFEWIGWIATLVVTFHVLILMAMILGIAYDPGSINHVGYWDSLLRIALSPFIK